MDLIVRQEQEGDYDAVFDLITRAFGQNNEANLVALLRNDPEFVLQLSLVAVWKEAIKQHIFLQK